MHINSNKQTDVTKIDALFICFIYLLKNKKCADRNQRTKTQIPAVAKQTIYRLGILQYSLVYGICILSNSSQEIIVKKGYKYP